MLSCWRSYWRYLESVSAVQPNSWPFAGAVVRKTPKGQKRKIGAYTPAQVVALWKEAGKREDGPLADLIALGAYTGARIEELCSLKWADIGTQSFHIRDAKTGAGIREVPIHPALRKLLARLKSTASDEYLLPGLTFNKYEDRSNAIGKRFGRLKASMGYGRSHVFHSLRHTLVTMLEDAGVPENTAADIVGHEKPRITYGLYSAGASLATKAEKLALVKYAMDVC
jgi:integrase